MAESKAKAKKLEANRVATQNNNKSITEQQAIQSVKQLYKYSALYESEGIRKQNGLDYYYIHAYSIVSYPDHPEEGSHTATEAWCMVQKNNGKVYNEIMDPGLTTPLN